MHRLQLTSDMAAVRPVLVVLSGLPASGKTTLARELLDQDCEHICFDEVMTAEFSPENWRNAQGTFFALIEEAVKRRVGTVIADDNHCFLSAVKRLQRLARCNEYAFLHILLRVEPEVAVARNIVRTCPVPDAVIWRMNSQMERQRFLRSTQELTTENFAAAVTTAKALLARKRTEPEEPLDEEERPDTSSEEPMHRADLKLRALVAEEIRKHEGKALLAKALGKVKAEVLAALRRENEVSIEEAEDRAAFLFTAACTQFLPELR